MTDQEINIAIAESIGWSWEKYENSARKTAYGWFSPNGSFCAYSSNAQDKKKESRCLPDYCNDLNAVHEVVLNNLNQGGGAWSKYLENLRVVCNIHHHGVCLAFVEAAARQRAIAYLQTINKWEEGE